MIRPKSTTTTPRLSRAIRSAMIQMDLGYDQLGGSGVGRTWAYRIRTPGRMTIEDFCYLLDRLKMSGDILDDPKIRKEFVRK